MQYIFSTILSAAALIATVAAQCPSSSIDCNHLCPGVNPYHIQQGDTVGDIASRFGVTICAIGALNNIDNIDLIYAGATLAIPAQTCPSIDCPAYCPQNQQAYHILKSGDTFNAIAARIGTSSAEIQRVNPGLDPNNLQPQTSIKLPVCAQKF